MPSWVLRAGEFGTEPFMVAGQPAELQVTWVSPVTVRLTVRAVNATDRSIPFTGALVQDEFKQPAGSLKVRVTTDHPSEPTIHVELPNGESVQRLVLDAGVPGMKFAMPNGPLLGLGEGGPQYDRKGSIDPMRNGQSSYRLATHGTRAPVQWLLGTDGWAMFIHQPYGAFDFTGSQGRFSPTVVPPAGANLVTMPNPVAANDGLPLDIFVVASKDPVVIMREYARITGLPELPARWTLGYQQSHRTLAGPESVMEVARLLREKRLPCDLLIYLGTEFTPSGWNTRNGETAWHTGNFPDPKGMIDKLHADHFRVALHIVIEGRRLVGAVSDPCTGPAQPSGRTPDNRWPAERQVACYWPTHKELFDVGVDAWWPDQGDGYDGPSRFNRHRMYWEGTQVFKPNDRPYALHRNASAGIQRYGGYIWSGDVQSRWDTLAAHVPIGINTGLSGLPLWGTDIGGFYGTQDFTGELFVRWFQFAAFCPLFRSHGRNWHLHTPWGWDGGDGGPNETANFRADPAELNNKQVEPICRQYLELRSRLMPYSYTALKDTTETGLPMMRALWLHYPKDARAVERGDEYLWGRDILVAPVVEKGATVRRLYLPAGQWFDFWTEKPVAGGADIDRVVDLATTPLYVRAGAVIPTGPIKQYDGEPVPGNTQLTVYPGADGTSTLYEDDGNTFDYRKGESMRVVMTWRDAGRVLALRLAPGSRMLGAPPRVFDVRVAGSTSVTSVRFEGRPIEVRV
jgi:alpha-glucosidase (family GH31 glycosyl hydrolase)